MASPGSDNPHLDDELLIVRHSGEIPEVALHGSIYFLTDDADGPGIDLTPEELLLLKKMVVERYREIIARDLEPSNRNKSLYRGLLRCICNWRRMERFCKREGFSLEPFRGGAASSLISLLEIELADMASGNINSSINCSQIELDEFIKELRIEFEDLPEGWRQICLTSTL